MLLRVAVIIGTGAGIYFIFQRFKKIMDGSTSRPTQPNNGETANPDEDLSSEAEDAWRRKDYKRLLPLLEKDSPFPVGFSIEEVVAEQSIKEQLKRLVEGRERLHGFIRDGDLDSIREFIRNHKSSVYYSIDNVSALSRAIKCDKREICSYLSSIRPNFRFPEVVIEESNWSQDPEKSHILKLVHATRFSENLKGEGWNAIIDMYLELDNHEEIRWLMKVIQYEDFEVYFEIKSIQVVIPGEAEKAFGITMPDGRIYIGGQGITTNERYRKVHGVCAHEICHLAMLLMYDNSWNPYHQGDKERKKIFKKIRDLYEKKKDIDEVIKEAYTFYQEEDWEGELIVRVPEIIGTYDKETANQIFKEQILELRNYYLEYILPDCKEFSNPDFHSIPLRQIKELSKYHGVVRGINNSTSPFNENFLENNKYEDYLIPLQNCTVLPTSNPKLCAMHIFHEQKRKFPIHAENRCLAFDLECCLIEVNFHKIFEALKSTICKTLILFVTKMESAWKDVINHVTENITEKKQIIIVTSTYICKELLQREKLNYRWDHLSINYQMGLLEKLITYQGRRIRLKNVIEYCKDTQVMNPDVLWHIMSQDELSIGEDISSILNERELYVERTFVRFVYKEDSLQMDQMPSHYLFITGVSELTVNLKKWSQTLSKYDDEIEKGKCIFVTKNEKNNSDFFKNFCSNIKKESKQVFWIHHTNGKYLLRDWLGRSEDIENHFVEETFDEYQMLKETDGMNVILVADDPGSGKSTSINSLMRKMKIMYPEKLICRVNFTEHLNEFSDSPSLPSLLEFIPRVCKFNNPLEKMAFKAFIGIHQRLVVFFDGFDEMTNDLQSKAMESLQLIRKDTQIQMWIFTRKHELLTLEEEMNTVSFSFRQFYLDNQCIYLKKFWVQRLLSLHHEKENFGNKFQEILKNLGNYSGKCERLLESMKELVNIRKENQEEFLKKIIELDFSDYAELVINSFKDRILKGEFMVPLWLWMLANIIIDSNFKIPDLTNRFTFYSNFLDKKVNSYLRNECGIQCQSKKQQRIYDRVRKIIFENLRKFSVKVMQSEHYEEISDQQKYDLKEDDLQELVDVGLLRKVSEEYHFFHMTFTEFFFSQMFVDEIESVNAKLLSDVLLKDYYREVRSFLDDFLEKDESQSFVFPKSLLEKFKLFEIYSKFHNRINDRTGDWIWKRLFQSCERHMKESVDEKSILNILNISPFNEKYSLNGVMDFLNSNFTDRMLFIIFESQVDVSHNLLFRCLEYIESKDLKAMISIFEKIINYKKSSHISGIPATDNSLRNIKVGLKIFENEFSNDDGSFNFVPSFSCMSDINIYLVSALSQNSIAFIEVLRFASTSMNGEAISKCLQRTDGYGNSVLHLRTENRKEKVMEDLREIQSILGNGQLTKLLTMQKRNGMTMLHILMEYSEDPKEAIAVLKYVEGVMEGESFKQFLIQKDNKGRFPISYADLHIMKDVLVIVGRYFSNEYIGNMLKENKVRLRKSIRSYTDCGLEEILYLEEFLGSELFKKILISKDESGRMDGWTRLHYVMEDKERVDKLFVRDLKVYASLLDSDSMRDFLFSQGRVFGFTFLHNWALFYRGSQYIDIFHELHSILSPDAFEHLLNIGDRNGYTFIHRYKRPLSDLSFLEEFLEKGKLIKLVTAESIYEETRLHRIYHLEYIEDRFDVLRKDIKFFSELLDKSSFRYFILTKDNFGRTFCYFYKLSDFNKLEGILSPDLFLELRKTVKSE